MQRRLMEGLLYTVAPNRGLIVTDWSGNNTNMKDSAFDLLKVFSAQRQGVIGVAGRSAVAAQFDVEYGKTRNHISGDGDHGQASCMNGDILSACVDGTAEIFDFRITTGNKTVYRDASKDARHVRAVPGTNVTVVLESKTPTRSGGYSLCYLKVIHVGTNDFRERQQVQSIRNPSAVYTMDCIAAGSGGGIWVAIATIDGEILLIRMVDDRIVQETVCELPERLASTRPALIGDVQIIRAIDDKAAIGVAMTDITGGFMHWWVTPEETEAPRGDKQQLRKSSVAVSHDHPPGTEGMHIVAHTVDVQDRRCARLTLPRDGIMDMLIYK